MNATERNVTIRVHCTELPGIRFGVVGCTYDPVMLGIQRGKETIDLVPGDAASATFDATLRVKREADGSPNFLGPYAQGPKSDRFLYLVWCTKSGSSYEMFRRLKIRLGHIPWKEIARDPAQPLEVHLRLTDSKGGPLCATPPPPNIEWRY